MSNLTLFQELEQLLRQHSQYTSEDGVMLKNSIVEAALQLRPDLLKLILSNDKLKANFFTDVEGMLVFDKVRFQKFVMNKRFLPDSYTSFKNKIGLTTDEGDFLAESREVVLSWPYKDCLLEGGQTKEDAKRNEVFWNEILAPDEINRLTEPKVLTNFKKFDVDGEHKIKSISKSDNLIIKGNNLLALHSLKKNYAGQVKLIYIDPPYNTGNDGFQYNDSFNHSSWLTFMKNRLLVARELLSESGSIWISCDDNEQAYLKVLCDEIFGEENFLSDIIWNSTKSVTNTAIISVSHTHNLLYFKSMRYYTTNRTEFRLPENGEGFSNPDNDIRGPWKADPFQVGGWRPNQQYDITNPNTGEVYKPNVDSSWKNDFVKFQMLLEDNRIIFGVSGEAGPQRKRFLSEALERGKVAKTIWDDIDTTTNATQHQKKMFGVSVFNNPKPEQLISRIIDLSSSKGDIVLDYHLGSGTTAAVAHKMGRRYIGIEQMDYIETVAVERLKKVIGTKTEIVEKISQQGKLDFVAEPAVGYQTTNYDQGGISKAVNWQGGGSFVYCELAKANQDFADKILNTTDKEELTIIWQQIQETGFMSWKIDPRQIDENSQDFAALSVENTQKFLLEALDKNLLYIPYSEIENQEFAISAEEKQLNAQFYGKA